jgi:hypothetical protein
MLLLIDSFDTYVTADLSRRYAVSGSPTIDAVEMRTGVGCLLANSYLHGITIAQSFTDDKFVIGFSFKTSDATPGKVMPLMRAMGGATVNLSIALNMDGTLTLLRSLAVLGTSTETLIDDTWHHIELIGEVSNSTTIECILKLDGMTVITVPTTADTLTGGGLTGLQLGSYNTGGPNFYFDSLYVMDTTGSKNNTFLGDCVVEAILPDGNGYNSDFDGSDADKVDNYLLIDEADPDDDSTYIEDEDVGGIDAFTYSAMAESPATIHGVAVTAMAKKTTANLRTIKQIARPASTNYEGSEHTLSGGYVSYQHIWEDNPEDAAAWEEADVNGSEFGVKVES